jgi:hypothetical protein
MMPALTGDVISAATSTTTTVAKVNGVSYPSGPSTHSVPVTTAANTETYKVVPDCTDTTGNHINYTQSTDAWSCGTSLPASVVTLTGTQTLTNKTLSSPTSTGTDTGTETLTNKTLGGTTPLNRLRANQGTPVAIGDWTIAGLGLGSWGTTASVVSVSGNDTAGSLVIACSGTGQSANPGFRLIFHDGAFPAAPVGLAARGDGFAPAVPANTFGMSTTTALFGLNGTCVAGTNYSFYYWVIGN